MAFQTDSTRVATLLLAHDGSNRSFADIGIPEGHHDLSHHFDNEEKIRKVSEIDHWYVTQFASFLRKLDQMKDTDGHSLLHNSMIVYGSGNADGNRHSHDNLPIILAGAGGGTLTPGRHIRHPFGSGVELVIEPGRPHGRAEPAALWRIYREAVRCVISA